MMFTPALLVVAALAFESSAAAPPSALLAKVGVIGASMTDGLLLPLEVDCMMTIEDVVRAASVAPLSTSRSSSSLMFLDPRHFGAREVDEVIATKPTLVLAIDYLFWFGYGNVWGDADARLSGLDEGLAQIARFQCPVIVGDFPDMHPALHGVSITGGPIIGPDQIPDVETLARLNARLAEWAKSHRNVHVVPLSRLVADIRDGREMRLRDNVWPAGSAGALIDRDLLHPTLDGTISVVLHALDQLTREDENFREEAFIWSKDEVRVRVLEAKKEERAARIAMKERRTSPAAHGGHR